MFEDEQNKILTGQENSVPSNLPSEPVDMLEAVDGRSVPQVSKQPDALSAGLLKPKSTPPPQAIGREGESSSTPDEMQVYTMKEPILGKIVVVILGIILLGGVGYAAFWGYKNFIKKEPAPIVNTEVPQVYTPPAVELPAEQVEITPAPVVEPVEEQIYTDITAEMNNDSILFGEPIDSDKDMLDDIREKEIGTNSNNTDTDADGLGDGDEVIIWKTNPLNRDTDGDGYLDGEEVRNGYNPLGPGKLFNIPTTTQQ